MTNELWMVATTIGTVVKKRLEVADLYPSKDAREKADAVIEALSDELPMTEYIRRWELAYREAGGQIRKPKGQRT